jgi:hypothetical protein
METTHLTWRLRMCVPVYLSVLNNAKITSMSLLFSSQNTSTSRWVWSVVKLTGSNMCQSCQILKAAFPGVKILIHILYK